MADAAQQLQEAYEQIEDGNLQAARQLLDDIRPQHENNPDFWWVYVHAIEDEEDGRNALNRVRQLAPNYPGLQQLEEQSGLQTPHVQSLKALSSPPSTVPMEEDIAAKKQGSIRNWLVGIGGFAILVVIILAIVFVSGIFGGTTPELTPVVDQSTLIVVNTPFPTVDAAAATDESSEIPSEAPTGVPVEPTEMANSDPFTELYAEIETFGVLENGITTGETSLGNSFIISTCTNPGPAANSNILGLMDTFAAKSITIPDDIDAMVFNITNCDTNAVTLALGIDRDTLLAYLAGDLSQSELMQALRRVG